MANRCSIKGCYQYYRKMRFERLLKKIDLFSRVANNFVMPEKCRKGVIRQYQKLVQLLSQEYRPEYTAAIREGTLKKITRPYLYAGDDEEPETVKSPGDEASSPLEEKALSSVASPTPAVVLTPGYT